MDISENTALACNITFSMDTSLHGHAAWTYSMDVHMDIRYGHTEWTGKRNAARACGTDMQRGRAARACIKDMQHRYEA
jgi:hypothetical protein